MLVIERQFPKFFFEVMSGLYRAVLSDPDVFLLTASGALLGSPTRRLRGIGTALAAYVTFRRLDQYVGVAVQIAQHASLNRQSLHMESNGTRTPQA